MDGPGEDSQILRTAQHPGSAETIAWTREHRRARVFCCRSGHDQRSYDKASFRTVFAQGVRWVARRI
jgi:type 1 glutamine amidotransferase